MPRTAPTPVANTSTATASKVIVLSDVHYGGPWLTAAAEQRVAQLLDRAAADSSVREVVLAGDSIELELHPITSHPPPMTRDVLLSGIAAGSPLLDSLRRLARAKRVTFIAGNHDHRLDKDALHELLGAEYWPPTEPFFVLRSDDGAAAVAIAHGHLDDAMCKAVLMPRCGFAESVAYFLGRVGACHEAEGEEVAAHMPVPLSDMMVQLVAKLRKTIPPDAVLAAARKPYGIVEVLVMCLTAYAQYTMGSAEAVRPDAPINCGDGHVCTWSDVVQLTAQQLIELLGDKGSQLQATSADEVWDTLDKLAKALDPNLRPHALRIARVTGAQAVILGHTHTPLIAELELDEDVTGSSKKRRVAYVNDGASCTGTTHVEIDLARRELALVDSADDSRKVLTW